MKEINVVLNHTKMELISGALFISLKAMPSVIKGSAMEKSMKDTKMKIDDQLVKDFGEFKITCDEAKSITIATYGVWEQNKKHMLSDGSRAGYLIRKEMQSVIDQFSGIVMDMEDAKTGTDFRKHYYLSRLDMNC